MKVQGREVAGGLRPEGAGRREAIAAAEAMDGMVYILIDIM